MPAIRTQGTQLYTVTGTTTVTEIGQIVSISGLGGARDQIDTTVLTDAERTFVGGFANPGPITLELVFDPTVVSHQTLQTLFGNSNVVPWMIAAADGTATPTATGGAFTSLTSRSNWRFLGYVADVNLDFSTNEVIRGTVTIQRSGAVTTTPKV